MLRTGDKLPQPFVAATRLLERSDGSGLTLGCSHCAGMAAAKNHTGMRQALKAFPGMKEGIANSPSCTVQPFPG